MSSATDSKPAAVDATATATAKQPPSTKEMKRQQQQWMARYEELKQFLNENGHCNVPVNWQSNKSLGRWVQTQRACYRERTNVEGVLKNKFKGTDYEERLKLMKEIGFKFETHQIARSVFEDEIWVYRYNKYKEYIQKHGCDKVSQIWQTNQALASWVHSQREWYQKHTNKSGRLITYNKFHQERIDLLNEVGFVWDAKNGKWMQRYNELKKFKEQYDHCNVPQTWRPNKPLGLWVTQQRVWYKQKTDENGQLKEYHPSYQERLDLLNLIDFEWSVGPTRK